MRARSYTIDAETEPRRYTPSSFRVRRPWERVSTRTSQPSARSSRRRVWTEATTPLTTGSHQSVVSSTRSGRPEVVAGGSGCIVFAFTPRGSHPVPAIASPERMRDVRPWSDPRARRVLRTVLASMLRAYGRAPGATTWHARPVAGSFPLVFQPPTWYRAVSVAEASCWVKIAKRAAMCGESAVTPRLSTGRACTENW